MNPLQKPSLPPGFILRMQTQFLAETPQLLYALDSQPCTSLRLNPFFKPEGHSCEAVEWSQEGYYVENTCVFGTDPAFQAGGYYVQEAASMSVGWLLKKLSNPLNKPGVRVLDACAAPGGKSTHLLSLLHSQGTLVANEVTASRYPALVENLSKWGYANQVITRSPIEAFSNLDAFFDLILIDAPCSGEGMFRKTPEARTEWKEESERSCAIRQTDILLKLLPSLKPGGILLYSTCTFAPMENEGQMEVCMQAGLRCITPDETPGQGWRKIISPSGAKGWQAIPGAVKGEGFFISAFQKQGQPTEDFSFGMPTIPKAKVKFPFEMPKPFVFLEGKENSLFLTTDSTLSTYTLLQKAGIKARAGLKAGEWKGDKFIPDAELAFWKHMPEDTFPILSVDRQDAIRFLRKENIINMQDGLKGIHKITYRGLGLGWVNCIPGRQNNLYPLAWRLRDTSNPALDPFPEQ